MFHGLNVSEGGRQLTALLLRFGLAVIDLEPKVSAPDWMCDRPLAGVQSLGLYIWVNRQ